MLFNSFYSLPYFKNNRSNEYYSLNITYNIRNCIIDLILFMK